MKKKKYALLVIMDGLRRDMATPENTPNVFALRERGVWFDEPRTVFPSVTRAVSSSIATGAAPERHGLFGNCVALPEDGGYVVHNVGAPEFIPRWRSLRGRTLALPTLAERLAPLGAVRVFSNVSPGAAYLQDPDGHGFVYHRAGCFGPGRAVLPELSGVGKGADGDKTLTDMCLGFLAGDEPPPLSVLWFSEPDHSGHGNPLGSPAHLAAIRAADERVGEIHRFLSGRPDEDWLLIVGSDHGQETEVECVDVTAAFVAAGLKESADSHELVIAPNGSAGLVYAAPSRRHTAAAIRDFLLAQPWCGGVRLFPESADSGVSDVPACYFSMAKTPDRNAFGIPGATLSVHDPFEPKERLGFGTHGGLGAYEQSPFLLMCGAGRPRGKSVAGAVSVLDIAPTVLAHFGLARGQSGAGVHHLFSEE